MKELAVGPNDFSVLAYHAKFKLDPFSSDDIIALVLAKPDAIQEWRDVMGHTNPIRAKQETPHTLRARYGHDQTRNALHGSDSYLSAEREIKFVFPEGTCTCMSDNL